MIADITPDQSKSREFSWTVLDGAGGLLHHERRSFDPKNTQSILGQFVGILERHLRNMNGGNFTLSNGSDGRNLCNTMKSLLPVCDLKFFVEGIFKVLSERPAKKHREPRLPQEHLDRLTY